MLSLRLFWPNAHAKFNWFMCGSVYDNDVRYLDVSPNAVFFSEDTGRSYKTKKGTRLIKSKVSLNDVIRLGYDGMIIKTGTCQVKGCFLTSTYFYITLDKLEEIKEECSVISYAKRNNSELKSSFSNFPGCEEIDALVKEFGCHKVSKGLYRMVEKGQI